MQLQRWEQVQAVLEEAQAAPRDDREAVLAACCGADAELRREVASLLAASENADAFFEDLSERIVDAIEAEESAAWLTSEGGLEGFRVIEKLASGGMGDVYRATDERLRRDVALKVLSESSVDDPKLVARFNREARLLAALNHPSIAAIYGLEVVGDRTVLVLEFVEGPTLAERLKAGRLPVAEAVEIGRQIAAALEAAHDKGIVHRDLKPANVKFTSAGQVKLLDFGISKALRPPESSDATAGKSMSVITETGGRAQVLGTVPYMSPEQLGQGDVGLGSDLWSLGVVLFEALSGQRPFGGAFPIARILERDPDWGLLPADVPKPLIELIQRCLQKDTSRRLRTASEARAILEALGAETTADGDQG